MSAEGLGKDLRDSWYMMSMSKSTDDGLGLREFVQCPARNSGTKYRLAPLGNHCLLARCKRHVLLCGGAFTWTQYCDFSVKTSRFQFRSLQFAPLQALAELKWAVIGNTILDQRVAMFRIRRASTVTHVCRKWSCRTKTHGAEKQKKTRCNLWITARFWIISYPENAVYLVDVISGSQNMENIVVIPGLHQCFLFFWPGALAISALAVRALFVSMTSTCCTIVRNHSQSRQSPDHLGLAMQPSTQVWQVLLSHTNPLA